MAKRTKILCTLGPAVDSPQMLRGLIDAGMDIARLNFSHGSHAEHAARIKMLKEVRVQAKSPCAIMLDTKGPEIRTGSLQGGQPIMLHAGDTIELTESTVEGTAERVFQTCTGLGRHVQPGTTILVDDGLIELKVKQVQGTNITCSVENDGVLGEHKSINVPGVDVDLPVLTEQDEQDLLFGIEQGVDFVAASFMRTGTAARLIKKFLTEHGGAHIGLISKIENEQGVNNCAQILRESDGIMIARGDLGVEVPEYLVPHIQKKIIGMCNAADKPVITATQMLDSMIRNPRPTRAEVGDVANAVYDGTDALMLSGETAAGAYPIESVKMMAKIAEVSEPYLRVSTIPGTDKGRTAARVAPAVGTAAVSTAESVGATCIVTPTTSGRTARLISNLRPSVPIYAVTSDRNVLHRLQIWWGVTPFLGDTSGSFQEIMEKAREEVCSRGLLKPGDLAVFTAGDSSTSPTIDGQGVDVAPTNVMQVVQVR